MGEKSVYRCRADFFSPQEGLLLNLGKASSGGRTVVAPAGMA
jgi:hypothetical protein